MIATRATMLFLALPALAGIVLGQEQPPDAPDPGRPAADPSMFRIDPPSSRHPLTGTYSYTSPLDGQVRRLVIEEGDDGFWKYLGRSIGEGEPALKLASSPGPGGYKGETGPGLDPCLAERTQVDRAYVFEDRIALVLYLPYVPNRDRTLRKKCDEQAVTFRVIPRGGGKANVRLTPTDEVLEERRPARAGAPGDPMPEAGDEIDYPRQPRAEVRFSFNAPKVPTGTPVRVTRQITDGQGRTWYHVVAEVEPGDEPRVAGPEDKDVAADGWVRPEQVVGRLSYTLHREPAGGGSSSPSPSP